MNTEPSKHRFLKLVLPSKAFAAIKGDTKKWLMECSCGYKQDYWDAGGVRYKAAGEPRRLGYCPACGKNTMQKIRKKTQCEQNVFS
jgi:hypothetical protein